ncbi:FkbM family methyltransferase [Bradyrhizobium sp. USDA 10063]
MLSEKTVRFFLNYAKSDPLKFMDMLRRRAIEQLSSCPSGIASTRFGDVRYEIDMSMHRLMRKYYFHTHEMFLERVFDRYLKPGMIFIDIGANCGYWSAYALARVERRGEVHSFEPVPQYFRHLTRLSDLNPQYSIQANNMACGAFRERLAMSIIPPRSDNFDNYNTNIGSSSLFPGFLSHAQQLTEALEVEVVPFDEYLASHAIDLDRIGLIKIDVEGFEGAVFDGMPQLLGKAGRKVPILCEILTDSKRSNSLDGAAIIQRLDNHGYSCVNATNLQPIDRAALGFEENVLFT